MTAIELSDTYTYDALKSEDAYAEDATRMSSQDSASKRLFYHIIPFLYAALPSYVTCFFPTGDEQQARKFRKTAYLDGLRGEFCGSTPNYSNVTNTFNRMGESHRTYIPSYVQL